MSDQTEDQDSPDRLDNEGPPEVQAQMNKAGLAPPRFVPLPSEQSCDCCVKAGQACVAKLRQACLSCNKMKMKCSLMDRSPAQSHMKSDASWSTGCQHWLPSRVPVKVAPPTTGRPAKRQRSSSTHPTPGPSKAKGGKPSTPPTPRSIQGQFR